MYDSRNPYPSWFDEIEDCPDSETCEFSDGQCFDAGECLKLSK